MGDKNWIACLYPAAGDSYDHSYNVIHSNAKRWTATQREQIAIPTYYSRPGFLFTVNPGPKGGARQGFLLGTDASTCDIVMPKAEGISPRHCRFTFRANGEFIMRDLSDNGMIVSYDQKGKEKRSHFEWIIGGDKGVESSPKILIRIHPKLQFEIVVFYDKMGPYDDKLRWFIGEAVIREQRGLRNLDSRSKTLIAEVPALSTDPIYLSQERLGEGGFGSVDRVWDVSTGVEYASKSFHNIRKSDWQQEASMLRSVSHVSKPFLFFRREILTPLQPNIVNLIRVLETPKPQLIFEFHPLGSLDRQNELRPISLFETLACLLQGLDALAHLHTKGMAHRDIKPANMLLKCRNPWQIVLADFGLSKIGPNLLSFCGTYTYTAPEIYGDFGYTQACDIWSLGVVIFEFAYGLPPQAAHESGMAWAEKIIRALQALDPDPLTDFLSKYMLVIKPASRKPAESCLEAASWIGSSPFQERIRTPIPVAYASESQATMTEPTVVPSPRSIHFHSLTYASSELRKNG